MRVTPPRLKARLLPVAIWATASVRPGRPVEATPGVTSLTETTSVTMPVRRSERLGERHADLRLAVRQGSRGLGCRRADFLGLWA
jgi:hypothetical protein